MEIFNSDSEINVAIVKAIEDDSIYAEMLQGGIVCIGIYRFAHKSIPDYGDIIYLTINEPILSPLRDSDIEAVQQVINLVTWQKKKLSEAFKNNRIIQSKVIEYREDKRYYKVNVFGRIALLYENQTGNRGDLYENDVIPVIIEKLDLSGERPFILVSSAKAEHKFEQKHKQGQLEQAFNSISVGDVVETKIEKIENNRIAVMLGPLRGSIFRSDLFWNNIQDPSKYFSEGDTLIAAIILKEKTEKGYRVNLSHKFLIPNPWEKYNELCSGLEFIADVTYVSEHGISLKIDRNFEDCQGFEGFLPKSEVSRNDFFSIIQKKEGINIYIKEFDAEQRNLIFTRKPYYEALWDNIEQRYSVGSDYNGVIIAIDEDGLWVELEKNIEIRIPKNDIFWDKTLGDINKYQVGENIKIRITKIVSEKRSINASIKLLKPNPWELSTSIITKGDTIKVKVVDYKGKFLLIETIDDLHLLGRIRLSELSWIYNPSDLPNELKPHIDNIIEAKVMILQPEKNLLELSIRQLQEDPWSEYTIGSEVSGTIVKKIDDKTVEITLENGLTAVTFESELGDRINEKYQFKIIELIRLNKIVVNHKRLMLDKRTDSIVRNFFKYTR